MPIRFRCSMCSGMLSIASRKAGSEVECPKCGYEVTVPEQDAVPEARSTAVAEASNPVRKVVSQRPAPDRPLFEHSDFDRLLDAKVKKAVESKESKPVQPEPVVKRADESELDDSVQLGRNSLFIMGAVAVILIVLAFAVGFLVGS